MQIHQILIVCVTKLQIHFAEIDYERVKWLWIKWNTMKHWQSQSKIENDLTQMKHLLQTMGLGSIMQISGDNV